MTATHTHDLDARIQRLEFIVGNMDNARGECSFSRTALADNDPQLISALHLAELALVQVQHVARSKLNWYREGLES